jgi:hypothetical protein
MHPHPGAADRMIPSEKAMKRLLAGLLMLIAAVIYR